MGDFLLKKNYQGKSKHKFKTNFLNISRELKYTKYTSFIKKSKSQQTFQIKRKVSIYYLRSADDLLIGAKSTYTTAMWIYESTSTFLKKYLKLICIRRKTKIIHSSKSIDFLGMKIQWPCCGNIKWDKTIFNQSNKAKLNIPIGDLLKRSVACGFAIFNEKNSKKIIAKANSRLFSLKVKKILKHYNSIITNFINYYSVTNRYPALWKLLALYKKSCALTLSEKKNMQTSATAFKTYGFKQRLNQLSQTMTLKLNWPSTLRTCYSFKKVKKHINISKVLLQIYS